MTKDFDRFLTDCLAQEEDIFTPESQPLSVAEIAAAEEHFGVTLPESYKYFLQRCGSGIWCDEPVSHPTEFYEFDSDCLEMEGFIALVQNVRGAGDYVAFNPQESESEDEPPVYYCSHDPFGHMKIADSFEDWLRKMVDAQNRDVDLYESAF